MLNEQERHLHIAQRMYENLYNQKMGNAQPYSEDEEMMGDCEDEDSINDEDIDRYLENEQKFVKRERDP